MYISSTYSIHAKCGYRVRILLHTQYVLIRHTLQSTVNTREVGWPGSLGWGEGWVDGWCRGLDASALKGSARSVAVS